MHTISSVSGARTMLYQNCTCVHCTLNIGIIGISVATSPRTFFYAAVRKVKNKGRKVNAGFKTGRGEVSYNIYGPLYSPPVTLFLTIIQHQVNLWKIKIASIEGGVRGRRWDKRKQLEAERKNKISYVYAINSVPYSVPPTLPRLLPPTLMIFYGALGGAKILQHLAGSSRRLIKQEEERKAEHGICYDSEYYQCQAASHIHMMHSQ